MIPVNLHHPMIQKSVTQDHPAKQQELFSSLSDHLSRIPFFKESQLMQQAQFFTSLARAIGNNALIFDHTDKRFRPLRNNLDASVMLEIRDMIPLSAREEAELIRDYMYSGNDPQYPHARYLSKFLFDIKKLVDTIPLESDSTKDQYASFEKTAKEILAESKIVPVALDRFIEGWALCDEPAESFATFITVDNGKSTPEEDTQYIEKIEHDTGGRKLIEFIRKHLGENGWIALKKIDGRELYEYMKQTAMFDAGLLRDKPILLVPQGRDGTKFLVRR